MKTHTSNFKNEIATFGRELDSVITYEFDGETIELGNEQLNSVSPHYEGAILKSVMKQLDIESTVEIPLETQINYRFGIKVRDDEVQDYRDNYDYIDYGNYIVYKSEKQEDTGSYKITCYDKMLYSMKDYENFITNFPISLRDYINALCNKIGLVFKNQNEMFRNYNKQINAELFLDAEGNSLQYTFRDVLDQLAEVTASTICLDKNDQLEIRYITNTQDIIDEEYLKNINVNFGKKYGPINSIVLSRSAESDNVYLRDEESVLQDGLCELKIIDNQIMNFNDRSDYLQDILDQLDGLEYYLNDFSSTGICYYDLCDRYNIQIGEEIYSCVMFNDEINITTGLEENIHTDMPEETQTDYKKADKTDRKINQTYIIVDKQNQTIESVVSNVSEQNTKISQITQTVDELNSKISDIADITISGESNFATFTLDNINESEPIQIKVKPVSENISYLYPHSNLYPSSNLYPKVRKVLFENLTTNEIFEYVLPDDLLYYNNSVYDEFILDYGDRDGTKICQVIKRCQYNADGTVSPTGTEQIVNYPYPTIMLTDGDYKLSLQGYEYGYLFARLMAKNIYTTQFATKVEMNSKISQTTQEINLEVSKKVGNNEIISKINQSAEQISINANKIKLEGYTTINNGFSIDNSGNATMNNAKVTGGKIELDSNDVFPTLTIGKAGISENIIHLEGSDSGSNPTRYYALMQRPTTEGSTGFIQLMCETNQLVELQCSSNKSELYLKNNNDYVDISTHSTNYNEPYIQVGNGSGNTYISPSGIWSPAYNNGSTEDIKKNIKPYTQSALEVIKNTDIYSFNYKNESDDYKKHIGAIIGDNYNCSKEIISSNKKGIDLYAMVSVCFKAIQEQQKQIEKLQQELQKLKEEK